jgi:hypothetical protein
MALWFAVIRAREFMQQNSNIARYANNRWATRAQQYKRTSINIDDDASEMWQQQYG